MKARLCLTVLGFEISQVEEDPIRPLLSTLNGDLPLWGKKV